MSFYCSGEAHEDSAAPPHFLSRGAALCVDLFAAQSLVLALHARMDDVSTYLQLS